MLDNLDVSNNKHKNLDSLSMDHCYKMDSNNLNRNIFMSLDALCKDHNLGNLDFLSSIVKIQDQFYKYRN